MKTLLLVFEQTRGSAAVAQTLSVAGKILHYIGKMAVN